MNCADHGLPRKQKSTCGVLVRGMIDRKSRIDTYGRIMAGASADTSRQFGNALVAAQK